LKQGRIITIFYQPTKHTKELYSRYRKTIENLVEERIDLHNFAFSALPLRTLR